MLYKTVHGQALGLLVDIPVNTPAIRNILGILMLIIVVISLVAYEVSRNQ